MFEATVWTLFDGECGKQRLLFGHCLRLLLGECGNRGYCLDIGQCLPHGRMFVPGSHHSASQCTAINSRQTSAVYSNTVHLFWPSKITKNQNGCMQSRYCSGNGHCWKRKKKPVYHSLTSVDGTQPTTNFLAKLPPIKTLNRGL